MKKKSSKSKSNPLTNHPAWQGSSLSGRSKTALRNQKPFSYVVGLSDQPDLFAVAWVQEDGLVAQSEFEFDATTQTWIYKNGTPHECKSFEELLSSMFHCSKADLSPKTSKVSKH